MRPLSYCDFAHSTVNLFEYFRLHLDYLEAVLSIMEDYSNGP